MALQAVLRPRWALRLAGSAVFAALIAGAATVIGVVGSIYTAEIASSFPLTLVGPWTGWSGRASAFWAAVICFAWLVYLRQLTDDTVRGRLIETTESAEQTSRRIEEFSQTLPPAGFQAQLTRFVDRSHVTMTDLLPRKAAVTPDELAPVIRAMLHGLATLALTYDNSPLVDGHSAVYSANIMVFVPQPLPAELTLRFLAPEHDRAQLMGALVLRQDLSATSDPPTGEAVLADAAVPAIALPLPYWAERDGRWVALLGGPRAYLTGEVDGYVDTAQFADECQARGDFQPSVIEALRVYFATGPGCSIRSFVSRRLDRSGAPVGVVNLHANRRDLLGPRPEKREIFHALATPLIQDLADAVGALVDAAGPLPREANTGTMVSGTSDG
jgi:hypothetical protein